MAKFADDHPIEVLRGEERLGPADVRYMLARRAAWLASRIEVCTKLQEASGFYQKELKAIAQCAEFFEKKPGEPPMSIIKSPKQREEQRASVEIIKARPSKEAVEMALQAQEELND